MEIVDVKKENDNGNYDIVVLENKSTKFTSMNTLFLFESNKIPSNLFCLLRMYEQNKNDIYFEDILILPEETFIVFIGKDSEKALQNYGGKAINSNTERIQSKYLTLANIMGKYVNCFKLNH